MPTMPLTMPPTMPSMTRGEIICSLNQIEQLSRKAVRGAGLAWGVADDAGKAVRWLHEYGLCGVAALAAVLECHADDYAAIDTLIPQSLSAKIWTAEKVLDPLLTGAAISDCLGDCFGDCLAGNRSDRIIATAKIAHPILIAGYIVPIAQHRRQSLELAWADVSMICAGISGDEIWVAGNDIAVESADNFTCHFTPIAPPVAAKKRHKKYRARIGECVVDAKSWARLDQFAHRTYVRASEKSRIRAG